MPRWPIDATGFDVSVTRNVKCNTSYSYVPKPILAKLVVPKRIRFVIRGKGDEIRVTCTDQQP